MMYDVNYEMHEEFFQTERTRMRTKACVRIALILAVSMIIGTYINATTQPFTISMSHDGSSVGELPPMMPPPSLPDGQYL